MAEHTQRRPGYREGLGGEMLAEFLGTFVLILLGIGRGRGRRAARIRRQEDPFGPETAHHRIRLGSVFGIYAAGGISEFTSTRR